MFVLFGNNLSILTAGMVLAVELIVVHVATVGCSSRYTIRAVCYTITVGILLLCPTTGSYYQYNMQWIVNSYTLEHLLQNIIIFFPLGYYWRLTIGGNWCILVLLIFGTAIELLQLLVSGRVCDIMDIVGNSIGSILGLVVACGIGTRRTT